MTPLIEARGVTKILEGVVPVTLVKDINLAIMQHEFIAITGPSGSGKSSLLYLLGLLDLPTIGDVLIDNRSTNLMTEDERAEVRLSRIGFVFQFISCCRNSASRRMSHYQCARWADCRHASPPHARRNY